MDAMRYDDPGRRPADFAIGETSNTSSGDNNPQPSTEQHTEFVQDRLKASHSCHLHSTRKAPSSGIDNLQQSQRSLVGPGQRAGPAGDVQ
ncbi:hypothetical protein HYFRA_00012909 [Hymenoscyphus fraxineus]|uniref:Uncharacterized protein n=1 Tax=Hymenoscyphus fraxineus TaxID=746836 RepID=A0A9N9PYP8_9HELO|nr:hypothetical protein HYFRA_00012909 [Hymenoscyphus fraxineus]